MSIVMQENYTKQKKNDNIIKVKEYKNMCEFNLLEKLKKAEQQIENGEVLDSNVVFDEMREKYRY